MSQKWTLDQAPSQAGKRIFITGANSGVGYYAAVELARCGAIILFACRDRARGEAALRQLAVDAAGPGSAAQSAELVVLDLASLASVRQAAESELARSLPLDVLINNAGVMAPAARLETVDGFELQFGTNVLGHFALTCLLRPALERAQAARVVTLASIAHKRGRIQFDDLQSERGYDPRGAYNQSKLADLMFSFELERRLRTAGSHIISIAVHPGVARTKIVKIGSGQGVAKAAEKAIAAAVGLLLNTGPQGALPTIFAATSPEAKGGCYYGPQGLLEARGGDVGPAQVAKQALDADVQQRLWKVCAELTGVDF
jgi:NAD(P)-dependent dehydrogenase (short-subunit alcohol dehydrogenase family)